MMILIHDRKRMSQKKKKEAVVEVYQQVIGEQKLATISSCSAYARTSSSKPCFREFRTPFNQQDSKELL